MTDLQSSRQFASHGLLRWLVPAYGPARQGPWRTVTPDKQDPIVARANNRSSLSNSLVRSGAIVREADRRCRCYGSSERHRTTDSASEMGWRVLLEPAQNARKGVRTPDVAAAKYRQFLRGLSAELTLAPLVLQSGATVFSIIDWYNHRPSLQCGSAQSTSSWSKYASAA
jgi:hypothetical protein